MKPFHSRPRGFFVCFDASTLEDSVVSLFWSHRDREVSAKRVDPPTPRSYARCCTQHEVCLLSIRGIVASAASFMKDFAFRRNLLYSKARFVTCFWTRAPCSHWGPLMNELSCVVVGCSDILFACFCCPVWGLCVVCVWFILYGSLRKAVKTHLAFLFSFSFRLKRNLRVRHCDKIYVFFLSKHLNIS